MKDSTLRPVILAAAERLIRSVGLTGTTTRAIAREAGCSEGAIYVHFRDRVELLLAVLQSNVAEMLGPLRALEDAAGKGKPAANLEKAMRGMYRFHQRATPMLAGLFAEPALLMAFRKSLTKRQKGPQGAMVRLEKYIEEEQRLGRLPPADAVAVAAALMATSFFHAFVTGLFGNAAGLPMNAGGMIAALLVSRSSGRRVRPRPAK